MHAELRNSLYAVVRAGIAKIIVGRNYRKQFVLHTKILHVLNMSSTHWILSIDDDRYQKTKEKL